MTDSSLSARLQNLPQMVAGVFQGDARIQLEATTHFRKLLSIEKNPPIDEVIACRLPEQVPTRHIW